MLRTHRAGKGPGGCGGWGLGSRNRRGPGVPPTPGLRGQGTSPGSSAGPTGILLYAPRTHVAWRGRWRGGYQPGGSADSLGPSGRGNHPCSSPALPRGSLPYASPDLPCLRGADPVWPPLLLPAQSPTSYRFTWGLLPSPWASGSPTSGQQAP